MKIPLQITFRNLDRSEAMEAQIQKKAAKLDQFCDDIISCRVMVEARHRNHHKGNLYHVRLDITVPERELVVSRDQQDNHAHEDAYVAIRDAFEAARRQLEDYVHRRRGKVKHRDVPPSARVNGVPVQDEGGMESDEGHEIYGDSPLNAGFEAQETDRQAPLEDEAGGLGRQAGAVQAGGKRRTAG